MIFQRSLFLESIFRFLVPYFLALTNDRPLIEAEIVETLQSYGVRTRGEMLIAAQIMAYSFSALDVLAQAQQAPDMSASMRLRHRGCANGLSRSCQQHEKTLEKRLKCDVPEMVDDVSALMSDMTEEQTDEAIELALNDIASRRAAARAARATTATPNTATPDTATPDTVSSATPDTATATQAETPPASDRLVAATAALAARLAASQTSATLAPAALSR